MNSDEVKSLLVKLGIMLFTGLAAKYHISGDTVIAFSTDIADLVVLGYGIYGHWNMKKVPETSVAIQQSLGAPVPPVGKTVTGSVTGTVVGCLALLVVFGSAHAQTKRPLICDPLNLIPGCDVTTDVVNAIKKQLTTVNPSQLADPDTLGQELAKPFQAIADFIASDSDGAIALSTAVPAIQDGHGQQCWMAMKSFGDIVKAHPVPLTLKVQTDVEAFRLLGMAANNLCANVHCTQVFADMSNTVAAAAPINAGLPIPTLANFCSKIPQIAQIPPISVPTPTPPATPPSP